MIFGQTNIYPMLSQLDSKDVWTGFFACLLYQSLHDCLVISVKSAYTYQLLKLIYMGLFLHYIVRNQIKPSFFLHLVRFLLVPLG